MKVIYHANCIDGFTAAWVVWRKYPEAIFIPANYSDDPPYIEPGEQIYIVDFSYPKKILEELFLQTKGNILVLDHHKTAEENCKGLSTCIFDMDECGASLAWQHFNPNIVLPELILYVKDYDLWQLKLSNQEPINAYIRCIKQTFKDWDALNNTLENFKADIITAGTAILQFQERQIEVLVSNPDKETIGKYEVPCINISSPTLISKTLHRMCKGLPFAASYFFLKGNKIYSLRSDEDGIDVSLIAQQFGGGGHKHAAGFKV